MRFRYRPFQAAVIAVLAALITACAAFAPLYDRAMGQALAGIEIDRAAPSTSGVQITGVYGGRGGFGFESRSRPPTPEAVAGKVPPDVRDYFEPPVLGYTAVVMTVPGKDSDPRGELVWRDGACEHLDLVEGTCPTAAGDIVVSEADAKGFGLRTGRSLRIYGIPHASGRTPTPRLTVTGVYRQLPGPYWSGRTLTGRSGLVDPSPPAHLQHDVWLTTRDSFEGRFPLLPQQSATADLTVDRAAVGVDELLAAGPAIDRLAAEIRTNDDGSQLTLSSGLPRLAADVQDQIDQSRVTVPLLMAQLGLLAVVVLWLVLLAITEQRRPEVALARLRGRGRSGARRLLLGELLPVTLAGVVPGVLLALAGSWVARTMVLPGDAPFELGLPLLAAVGVAVGLLSLVTVVAAARVVREPVVTLLRRVPPRRTGWGLGVADALVIAGCGSVVVVFATGGLEGPVALAAPGLLAIVVGLVLAHLTSPTAAALGRRLLARGRVRAGVSVVDAARSPATRRVVAIVTLATALAVFSADALLVGERNRAAASEQEAGAAMVADVRSTDVAAVRAALADVDPDGVRVTPVLRVLPPSDDARSTLAVVPDEFRRIAMFPGGGPSDAIWERLAAPDTTPIEVRGTRLALDVTDSTLRSRGSSGAHHPVEVGVDAVVTGTGELLHVSLGSLPHPVDHARLTAGLGCREGCYLTGIWLGTLPAATIDGSATLAPPTTEDGSFPLGPAGGWSQLSDPTAGSIEPSGSGDDLTISARGLGAQQITLPQAWVPTQLPALVSGPLPPGSTENRFTLTGVDGEEEQAARAATLTRVPASRPDTSVVNLDLATRGRFVTPTAQLEVWFADADPALLDDVTTALGAQGIEVGQVTRLADVRRTYDESAAAWSLQLAALVGAAALLIALLVLLVSAVSTWRFRTRDLAALRMAGVPRRSIGSMAVAAQLPAVVIGVVAGTAAGLYGAHLALPIVPLFAEAPEVSTLDLATAWGPVVLAALMALLVLGLGAVLIGRTMARRAGLSRLREGSL